MRKLFGLFLLICIALSPIVMPPVAAAFPALNGPSVQATDDSVYTRAALLDRFFSDGHVLIVFGASTPQRKAEMRQALEQSNRRWRSHTQEVRHVDEVTRADFAGKAVLLIGTPENNPFLTPAVAASPVSFSPDGFTFFGKSYGREDILRMMYPGALNPGYAMFMIAGWAEDNLLQGSTMRVVQDLIRSYDYQILRHEQRLRLGKFSQEPGRLWQIDKAADLDFEDDIKLVGTTTHFRFYTHNATIDHQDLAGIIQQREASYDRVAAFAGDRLPAEEAHNYKYYLYANLQDKAVITNSMEFAHVAYGDQAVHVGREPGIEGESVNRETSLIVRSWFGKAATTALEDGLAVMLGKERFGKPYTHMADRLAYADLFMPIDAMLDNARYSAASPLIREVLAGQMVSCMIEQWGKENFLENYNTWQPGSEEWPHLVHMWDRCQEAGQARYKPVPKRSVPAGNSFQRGFNFAHEGYGIVNGYGSREADAAIDKLKDMGTDAISVIPYTFMRDPNRAVPLRLANTAGDENDGAVAHATRYAQSIGFTTMIKPQIWLRGSWPGDIEMATEEEWLQFFEYYEHWITHYALLSEIFEADILCIGNEMSKATMLDEARWSGFANKLRAIYSGQLVYAPNWGEEFESLSFWDAFDYIGVNSYYPLSELDEPTDADLLAGARAVVQRMEKVYNTYKKPILITEMGYPNSNMPWKLPYQEDRQGPANPEHQARCYKAMVEALKDVDWLKGVYWWKWPSYLDRGGMTHRGFTPNKKLAEQVVTDWYQTF